MKVKCIYRLVLNKKGDTINILSYGINRYENPREENTTHAEIGAINNLPIQKNRKHYKKIDLLVIRLTHLGYLRMSKPCIHCILIMNIVANKRGYIIKNLYYSDSDGNIIKTNLVKLRQDDNIHISFYYRTHKFNY